MKKITSMLGMMLCATALSAQTVTQTVYVDFGYNNSSTNGMKTETVDDFGHYWTNVHCTSTDKYIYPGTTFAVVNSDNQSTGWQIFTNTRFSANGKSGGGGLLAPSSELLGDLAVASATEDYVFTEGHQNYLYFTFKGLDPTKAYRFTTFGSRTSTDDRIVTYRFQGSNSWNGTLQTGGKAIGDSEYNGNNNKTVVSDAVYPDNNGEITFTMIKLSGSYVPVNAMKIEELDGVTNPYSVLSLSQKMYIDFGEDNSDTRGHQTTGADTNGNYWNNIYCQTSNVIASGSEYDLLNAANTATGVKATVGAGLKTNGMSNGGGLSSPSADYLGDLAIATATEDYAFLDNTESTTIEFTGLNTQSCYRFYFFGSRTAGNGNNRREAVLTLQGQSQWNTWMITSGSSIGGKDVHGNTMNVAKSEYIYPDADGKITFTLAKNTANTSTNYAHLNVMKIEEYTGGTRPSEGESQTKAVYLRGTIVPDGASLTDNGDGTWSGTVTLDKEVSGTYANKTFYISTDTNPLATTSIHLNQGTYEISFNTSDNSYTISAPIDENRISVFGSSVSNGQGATSNHGYAYMYNEQLQSRYADGTSTTPFAISSIAINGNNTVNLLNRYDDLIHDFGRYVVFGLSLGNEGIHNASDRKAVLTQFSTNMQTLIAKAREDGKIPVVMNNYAREDFNADDYSYIKQMNLLIHEWDVPSANLLGAIDNGSGCWATGYSAGDTYHPNTDGHREFAYAIVPSLFDAIKAGKAAPVRNLNTTMTLGNGDVITFSPEGTAHPYALNVRVKGGSEGRIAKVTTDKGDATITVNADGTVSYASATGTLTSTATLTDGNWHSLTLSHYYAQKRTLLYVDDTCVGELSEQTAPTAVTVGDETTSVSRTLSELSFWRSALNADEVAYLNAGHLLQSSLEVYAPLSDDSDEAPANLAQSTNQLRRTKNASTAVKAVETAVDGNAVADFYTPTGVLSFRGTMADARQQLPQGLYIVNNKKVILK